MCIYAYYVCYITLRNEIICRKLDGTGEHHIRCNKPDLKRQIPVFFHMWKKRRGRGTERERENRGQLGQLDKKQQQNSRTEPQLSTNALVNAYRVSYSTTSEYSCFSAVHGTFSKAYCTVAHRTCLSQ